MVTYGCESIEDFYSSCATREVIGEVKVPLLFIQNDDVVPPYTIPRSSIAENPFTSLLLCSSSPNLIDGRTVAVSWCQDLASEASFSSYISLFHTNIVTNTHKCYELYLKSYLRISDY
jgi:hypothetical protein